MKSTDLFVTIWNWRESEVYNPKLRDDEYISLFKDFGNIGINIIDIINVFIKEIRIED
jgi:hypothetical protein